MNAKLNKKTMKTTYLDKEIQLLNSIKRNNEISDYGQEKLNEFIAIKKQLLLHNVSQQREQLCDCGKPVESEYAPCCSLSCWCEMFEGA